MKQLMDPDDRNHGSTLPGLCLIFISQGLAEAELDTWQVIHRPELSKDIVFRPEQRSPPSQVK